MRNSIIFSGIGGFRVKYLECMSKIEELPDVGGFGDCSDGFRTFYFMGKPVRVKNIDGEPWFVGKDIAVALGYSNSRDAMTKHVEVEDKTTVAFRYTGSNYKTRAAIINESGMYSLVLQSRLKDAKKFKRWITHDVIPTIRKTGGYGRAKLPDFAERYKLNCNKIPYNYFSVLNEMWTQVYKEFERVGYILPDVSEIGKTLMPDISLGKCFAKYLRDNGVAEWTNCKKYWHDFADGRSVEALMYPLELLPTFIRYVHEEWIPKKAFAYLKARDPKALEYLPKLLA